MVACAGTCAWMRRAATVRVSSWLKNVTTRTLSMSAGVPASSVKTASINPWRRGASSTDRRLSATAAVRATIGSTGLR